MWFAAGLALGLILGHALTFLWIAWPRPRWVRRHRADRGNPAAGAAVWWWTDILMSDDRDLLAEAAAHFAKALAHWRDLRFILEIAEERRRDFLGERPITRDSGTYHE